MKVQIRYRLRERRGSYTAEAALVMPLIITGIITVVLIIMFFFSSAEQQSRFHMELRKEAALAAGKTSYAHDSGYEGRVYSESFMNGARAWGISGTAMIHRGILKEKARQETEGSSYGNDGPGYVRFVELAGGDGVNER